VLEGEIAVVTVMGEVDLATVPALTSAVGEALAHKPAAVIVDLLNVSFLASAGLQALVGAHERVSGEGAVFAVVADGAATSRPIQLTGLDQILALHPTMAGARAAVNEGSERR
jgi:anti-anti-sigma factor